MLNIEIISLFSLKNKSLRDLSFEYEKRLKPFIKLKLTLIKPTANGALAKAQLRDEQRLIKYLDSLRDTKVFLLSEQGSLFNSIKLANFFSQHDSQSLTLVIANTLGFSDSFKKKFPSLSLSLLTYPHEFCQILLLEQIYRSVCILKGKDYHY